MKDTYYITRGEKEDSHLYENVDFFNKCHKEFNKRGGMTDK
jgi:hypothetical protein